jgi:uncharacterized protein (TIGR03437 family)
MKKWSLFLLLGCITFGLCIGKRTTRATSAVAAQVSLVNAASYEAVVAPGSIGALFGTNFTMQTQLAVNLPLPTTLGGVSVKIAGKAAPLFFVSPSQINLQVPSGISAGTAMVEVFNTAGALPVSAGTVTIADAAPGVFTVGATGRGQAIALNSDFSSNANFELWPGARPEVAGSYISIFATGIGNTNPIVADGQVAPDSPLAIQP